MPKNPGMFSLLFNMQLHLGTWATDDKVVWGMQLPTDVSSPETLF